MRKLLASAMLIAGFSFGFANDQVKEKEKNESDPSKNVENTESVDGCIRCVRSTTTTIDPDTGESSSSSIQYCYEVPCPIIILR